MGKKSSKKKKENKAKKVRGKEPVKLRSGPETDLEKNFREFEKRLEEVFSDSWKFPSRWDTPDWTKLTKLKFSTPRVDIVDRDVDVLIRADVPGVDKDDLEVSLTDNTITIKGHTRKEKKEAKGDYFRSETMKGSFSRTMYLPSDVDGSKAESSFRDGVLEVVVPKLEKAKRIKVEVD
ncbi:MAG: Hsp20/alpha crystallin family protein [Thiotrichales bacterium]|nr:MAG: Hsp20/alpha crystallin family protein [Thiotrichales bacterium]